MGHAIKNLPLRASRDVEAFDFNHHSLNNIAEKVILFFVTTATSDLTHSLVWYFHGTFFLRLFRLNSKYKP